MKRLPLILSALALLVALASPVAARIANVTNPMSTALEGAGYDATDLGNVTLQGKLTVGSGIVYLDSNHNRPSIRWGMTDPNADPNAADAVPGSLYLEFAYNASGLWVETLPGSWVKVAG